MGIVVVGTDLGKNVSSVVGLDAAAPDAAEAIERFVEGLPRIVAMEACCGAHHLGRVFGTQGHEVRLDVAGIRAPLREGTEDR
jgi:transposase